MSAFVPRRCAFAAACLLSTAAAALAAAPSALADVATTGAASAVTSSSATVAGTINPGGVAGAYEFQYDTSTAYGAHTQPKTFAAGTQPISVSEDLAGLQPSTTYHFRLVTLQGTPPYQTPSFGADGTFTTPAEPLQPGAIGVPGVARTNAATNVTTTSATLNGVVNPQGMDAIWAFAYGTTTAYGSYTALQAVQGNGPIPVSMTIVNLTPGTTYHVRVGVIQGSYPSQAASAGADVTFTTLAKPAPRTAAVYGVASLVSRRIAARGRHFAVSLRCRGTARKPCAGTVAITARGRIGKTVRTVTCGLGRYSATAPNTRTVRGPLSRGCLTLLRTARRHQLAATLTLTFTTHQARLRAPVVLVG